jgi:hypothetical protein
MTGPRPDDLPTGDPLMYLDLAEQKLHEARKLMGDARDCLIGLPNLTEGQKEYHHPEGSTLTVAVAQGLAHRRRTRRGRSGMDVGIARVTTTTLQTACCAELAIKPPCAGC